MPIITSAAPRTQRIFAAEQKLGYRINSIDLLRGLVMVIMALDHTRDLLHITAGTQDPPNLQTTTPLLFFTRWITHFCAPVFVFLAGTSGYLQSLRKGKAELSRFLIKRGLRLVLIELTIMTFGLSFDIHFSAIFLQTFWAIGASMILLGAAIWLPFPVIFATGLLIVLGHNSLDFYEAGRRGNLGLGYDLMHHPGFYPFAGNHMLMILYPFLPWTGLMLLGYCFGRGLLSTEGVQRRKLLTGLGLGIIALFIVLRAANVYGDPRPWTEQSKGLYTVLSFINTQKYPPSLLFLCMTIGPALLFLAWVGNARTRITQIITVYGRVPFLYFVLHFYLLHAIAVICFLARGHSFAEGLQGAPNFPFKFVIPGEGFSIGMVYLIWLGVVVAMYPVCKWFSNYKQTHKQWWLSYL